MKCFLLLAALIWGNILHSQSYHFSQFYSTPLLLNPAFTGYMDGQYRVAGNFRSQWAGGGSPYTTNSLSADVSVLKKHIPEGNTLGFGVSVLNDRTLGGAVQTNSIGLSTAYNISLDQNNVSTIGLGFQGTYNERRIDFSGLSFENQFGGSGYDPSLPIGEPLPSENKKYLDINFGSVYHLTFPGKSFFAGLGVYNVVRHKENILQEEFKMPVRYSILAGGQADIGYDGIFYYSGIYQQQGTANELTVGAAYGIQVGTDKIQVVNFGTWLRIKDAVIPYIGYQRNGLQAGFSFDYTTSRLKTGSQVRNGFELSLVFSSSDNSDAKKLIPWF